METLENQIKGGNDLLESLLEGYFIIKPVWSTNNLNLWV